MDIESLIHINPEIMKFKKKYIYGTDDKSIEIFIKLINCRFFVDGFVDENYDLGNSLLNKPVVALEDTLQEDTAILCGDMPEEMTGNFFDMMQIFFYRMTCMKTELLSGEQEKLEKVFASI